MYTVYFKRIHPNAKMPYKAHPDDAAFDLMASEGVTLKAHSFGMVPTGVCIALPPHTEGQVRPRSGLAAKYGITVLNAPGTIDAGYRGELKVILINHGENDFVIEPGMRIAQLLVKPVYEAEFTEVEALDDTERGVGGFGSSGVK